MRALQRCVFAAGTAAVLVGAAGPVLALAGELKSPGIALSSRYPASVRDRVMKALNRKDSTFVDGHFINAWTSLRYRGEVRALNLFVDELGKCPGTTVSVSLKKLPEDCDWRVGHDGHTNRFQIEANLSSPRLNLEELVIPEVKGPRL